MRTGLVLVVAMLAAGCGEPAADGKLTDSGDKAVQDCDDAVQDRATVIDALANRIHRFGNIIVDYEITRTLSPEVQPTGADTQPAESKSLRWRNNFMRLRDLSKYTSHIQQIPDRPAPPSGPRDVHMEVSCFNDQGSHYLARNKVGKTVSAYIRRASTWPQPDIELALGMRGFLTQKRESASSLRKMTLDVSSNDKAVLTMTVRHGYVHRWTYDRKLDYALTTYERLAPDGKTVTVRADMSQFKRSGDLMLPMHMKATIMTFRDNRYVLSRTIEVVVSHYSVGARRHKPQAYEMHWPEDADIRDYRRGRRLTPAEADAAKP